MTTTKKDPVVIVLQLTGGNDYANTVIRYADPLYRDNRPGIGILEGLELRIDDEIGFHPAMGEYKESMTRTRWLSFMEWGIRIPPRSHFRSMDIWHTCAPDRLGHRRLVGPGRPGH